MQKKFASKVCEDEATIPLQCGQNIYWIALEFEDFLTSLIFGKDVNTRKILVLPRWWWAESLHRNRVKVSENLGATAVAPVAPMDTSLMECWTSNVISHLNLLNVKKSQKQFFMASIPSKKQRFLLLPPKWVESKKNAHYYTN